MAKKKSVEIQEAEEVKSEIKKLTWEQFWKYKFYIMNEKAAHWHNQYQIASHKLKQKEIENAILQQDVQARKNVKYENDFKECQRQYLEYKKQLEQELGTSLDNKGINEYTLEIVSLGG